MPESMPLVMRRLDSQHPFVTACTKIIFLMKANDLLLDFDARRPVAIMLNASSCIGALAYTPGYFWVRLGTE